MQIWGNRPLYYEDGPDHLLEGYWGDVTYAENASVKVYLGTDPEQIIERMLTVLCLCNFND